MAPIHSRKHAKPSHTNAAHKQFTKSLLALAIAAPITAHAQQAATEQTMRPVNVKAASEAPFKTDISANPKYTQPLLDTPQTIQVIKKEVLREQGASSLMEALRNTPGITMQLGENGNTSAGDTFQMRGFSTQTSTFIDGIRDLGAVTRDVFNLEQVEVVKGPAGADIGRGSASGYINLVSKLPTRDGKNSGTVSYGTADKKRVTADLNEAFGETGGFRLNAMWNDGGVDKRDEVENTGFAVAPSLALGLGTPTRFYFFTQHVRQENVPDGGIPSIGFDDYYQSALISGSATTQSTALANAIMNAPKVDRENFYGYKKDYEDVDADMVTVKFEHDLDAKTIIRNTSRYGKTEMDRVATGISSPSVSATTVSALNPSNPSSWTITPSRQRVDRVNEILANQTNLVTELNTGSIKHSLSGGFEIMYERQKSLTFSSTGIINPATSLYDPDSDLFRDKPYATGAYTDGDTTTAALYAFDTLELNSQWLLNGGLRYEHYRTNTDSASVVSNVLTPSSLDGSGNLFSWKAGVVFKPVTDGSIYVSYGTSETPPGSADFALSATANNQNNSSLDPQETDNYEIGTKWDLLNKQLSLSAALFRTENSKQTSFDDQLQPVQIGKTRVEGAEIAAVGQLNNFWQVSAGVTYMDSDALEQRSSTGVETTGVRWTPNLSATFWTSYTFGDFTIGGGARYLSEQKRTITVQAAPSNGLNEIPSYWAADAMLAYKVNQNVNLRLNVYNLTDEEYIETLNSGGSRVRLGQARSGTLTAEYTF